MKKILIVCGAAAALMLGACSGNSSNSGADKGFGDSLSMSLGQNQGLRLAVDYAGIPEDQKATLKKDDILRGFKQVIMTDTTQQGYLTGLSFGLQLAGQLYRYEQSGIQIDRAKVYDAYAKAFMSDSVSPQALQEAQQTFQTLAQQAQGKMMEYYQRQQEAAKAAKENSPEAKSNKEKGAAYIKDAIAKDPSIKTTPSGLAYKVVKEGQGETVGKTGSANVKYTGKLIDGTVFDSNDSGLELSPRGTVPGFGEGLAMMNKGSKYIFYIPGELAYGVEGAEQAGIGPNATLVFEVEAIDVTPGN
ncbi:FKBP-type peptidyl-prolyl cis-trans isomerase [uncultured Duncaniella sp.]|uniref:FKBP-type peptidyl-prolyl cis-trans isomerase n=1 Tax=uncultured Duncaniella sp. TaxID=2768039 RepID=UPI00272CFA27|nr:FKBP-type peptidyl-prolyl cis-trans isomerase [uncultured Duncaniella sp.]